MKALSILLLAFVILSKPVSGQNTSQIQKAEGSPFVLGVIDKIPSEVLSETRTLNIYLPNGYYKDPKATYPVIYLLDGSADEDFIHITGLVQFLTMIQEMPNSIIVGIGNVDRKRDFTFPTLNKTDHKQLPTSGGSEKFIAFIANELQPYIQNKYRVNAQKTIIGQSLGGLLATEILLKKPELFNNYIIVSPSLWWNDESLLADANALLKAHTFNHTKVYVAVGSEGKQMQDDAEKLAEILKSVNNKDLEVGFYPFPNENHLTILHNSVYKAFEVLNKKQE